MYKEMDALDELKICLTSDEVVKKHKNILNTSLQARLTVNGIIDEHNRLGIDQTALKLLSKDAHIQLIPGKTNPDLNCLFNAVSICLQGKTGFFHDFFYIYTLTCVLKWKDTRAAGIFCSAT